MVYFKFLTSYYNGYYIDIARAFPWLPCSCSSVSIARSSGPTRVGCLDTHNDCTGIDSHPFGVVSIITGIAHWDYVDVRRVTIDVNMTSTNCWVTTTFNSACPRPITSSFTKPELFPSVGSTSRRASVCAWDVFYYLVFCQQHNMRNFLLKKQHMVKGQYFSLFWF